MIWFTVIFIVAGIIFPIVDRFWDKRIKREKELGLYNKVKTYSFIMLYQWIVVGCIILGFFTMNISIKQLGLMKPAMELSAVSGFVLGVTVNAFLLFVLAFFIPVVRKKVLGLFDAIEIMLPNGWKERLMFAGVAITAGFCEEVIYRGFMFYYFNQIGWGLTPISIAIISSILFGLAHFYQGWKNVIVTALIGFAMARLFMSYESLWIPIIVHIIIDLRFAILPNFRKLFTKLGKV